MQELFNPKELLRILPEAPGVYRFYNEGQEIIYVGKAKNLKNRVSSYFNKSAGHSAKTERLVSQIRNIQFTIVNSEYDALLLENNLIKQHQPRYNILLRDDKTYPFICITKEAYPRIFPTRHPDPKKGYLYGPYANVKLMNTLLELFPKLFTYRSCTLNITEKNIEAKKFKVCLEYHIGNCKGPCQGLVSETEYNHDIEQVHQILKGNLSPVRQYFTEKMQQAAANLAFEQAQAYKEKLALLENYQGKSLIVNPKLNDADVFAIVSNEKAAYVGYIRVVNGLMVQAQNLEIKKKMEEVDPDILSNIIAELYDKSGARELITNLQPTTLPPGVELTIPQIGDKKKLLDLAQKNMFYFKKERNEADISQQERKAQRERRVLEQLQKDLQLKDLPDHIECFDNSNMQGTNPVAAMVCFKNGFPSKKDYRHFNIKTVVGPDDFASMKEIVTRRYTRLLNEQQPLPKLIIIDGGKGQLGAACEALEALNLYGQIPVVRIAKRLEEIYYPGDSLPLFLSKKSESLTLIQRIRDEAHRFAITFHRDQRSRKSLKSQLEDIPGIGEKSIEKLLITYKSVKKIREAPLESLQELIGKDKAQLLMAHLKTEKAP
jgi:excinuclease ABC subunit C